MVRSILLALFLPLVILGAVDKVYVVERGDVLDGRSFGTSGPYEWIQGEVLFSFDPALPANSWITDLQSATRNEKGMVTAKADLFVLKPRDPKLGNGTILYEVSNRGGKGMLSSFNFATSSRKPTTEAEFGDGMLLREGYTLVWLGWQHDVPQAPNALRIQLPKANGISGIVRSEFTPSKLETVMNLGDRDMLGYPVSNPEASSASIATLTVRESRNASRKTIPRSQWKFVDETRISLDGGFQADRWYELVYPSKNPEVVGLGMAATRDIISYLKYPGGSVNLLADQNRYLKRAIGFGISQSGRFLRHFLQVGANADEKGRIVFDGIWAHVAGAGKGSFNHRFAQPSRDGHPEMNSDYPTDTPPFTDLTTHMPETVRPKIFYTNGSYEYWGRAASLIHTNVEGTQDIAPPANTRIYFLTGTQHGAGQLTAQSPTLRMRANSNDYRFALRGLLPQLRQWITNGQEPPASLYPQLADKTLVPASSLRFPKIPGAVAPAAALPGKDLDFGPDFATKGIVTIEPPRTRATYPALVPAVDADGNERAGLRLPVIAVPLSTLTGWNYFANGHIVNMVGSTVPLATNQDARTATKDPRPSIAERYPSKEKYLELVGQQIATLVQGRYLLAEDKDRLTKLAAAHWDALATVK